MLRKPTSYRRDAFVDLTAAYNKIKHNIMLTKLYEIPYDNNFIKIIEVLISNRRFFIYSRRKK